MYFQILQLSPVMHHNLHKHQLMACPLAALGVTGFPQKVTTDLSSEFTTADVTLPKEDLIIICFVTVKCMEASRERLRKKERN